MEPAGKPTIPAGPSVAGTQAGAGVRGEMPRGPSLGAGICGSPQNAAAARPGPSPPSAGSRAAMAAVARAWRGLGAAPGHGGGGGSAQFGHTGAGGGLQVWRGQGWWLRGCVSPRGWRVDPLAPLWPHSRAKVPPPHGSAPRSLWHPLCTLTHTHTPPCTLTPSPMHAGAEPPRMPVPRWRWPRPGSATAQPTRPLSVGQLFTALSPSGLQICPHRSVCAPRNRCCPFGGQQQGQGTQTGTRWPQKPHPITWCPSPGCIH